MPMDEMNANEEIVVVGFDSPFSLTRIYVKRLEVKAATAQIDDYGGTDMFWPYGASISDDEC